jgi:glycosyltransferase involved in cell wall biosynthesis
MVINELDPELLADYIVNLLTNSSQLKLMSQAARLKVQNQLNWSNIAKTIAKTLSIKAEVLCH